MYDPNFEVYVLSDGTYVQDLYYDPHDDCDYWRARVWLEPAGEPTYEQFEADERRLEHIEYELLARYA